MASIKSKNTKGSIKTKNTKGSIKTKKTSDSKETTKKQGKGKNEPQLVVPDCWINELTSLNINDDEWSCSVVMIEETSTDASIVLDQFNNTAINGNRLAVKAITQTEVVEFVKKNILKEQGKRPSPLDLLCKEIYKEAGPDLEKIPTSLLAHLLKYIILEFKELNKHIRVDIMNKNKEMDDYRQSLWPPPNVKSASAKSGKTGKSEASSGKGKGKGGVNQPKKFTNLRKRGEDWKDNVWIDDAPLNGPQLYVALSNFYDSSLPLELLNLNMPLDAIIELEVLTSGNVNRKGLTTMPSSLLHFINEVKKTIWSKKLLDKKFVKMSKFWDEIEVLKTNPPTSLMFKNVMFLQMIPDPCESAQDRKTFQEDIYTQISDFMYYIFENYKLHKAYLDELEVKDVTDDRIQEPINMPIYNSILDNLPHESLTIACILDAILAQVCDSEIKEGQESEDRDEPQFVTGKLDSILKYLQKLNKDYDLFQEPDIKSDADLVTSIQSLKQDFSPIKNILIHSDDVSIKTFHLEKDIANFITSRTNYVLKSAWENFWTNYFVHRDNDNNIIRLCSVILESEKECNQQALCYYTYIMIINCILDSILMSSDFVPPEHARPTMGSEIKESKFFYNREDLCDDCLRELASANVILGSLHKLRSSSHLIQTEISEDSLYPSIYSLTSEIIANNLFYIEDMASDVLLQNLQTEFTKFNRFEARYCPFTEQLLIVFHNLYSVGDAWEETWVGKLTTKVPPRDFIEYTLEEQYSWLDSYINKSPSASVVEHKWSCRPASELVIPETFFLPNSHFLSIRSLKYEQNKKEQVVKKGPGPKSAVGSVKSTTDVSGNQIISQFHDMSEEDEAEIVEGSLSKMQKRKSFIGYELGEPQRFQFSGSMKEKLFDDQTRITIQKVQKLYSDESITLNVDMNGHNLYYGCKQKTASNPPFHIVSSSGIILYFGQPNLVQNNTYVSSVSTKKESALEPLPELNENFDNSSQTSATPDLKVSAENSGLGTPLQSFLDSNKFPHELKGADFHKIPLIYDLKMSTPSGLHVEMVRAQDKDLLYVRQQLLSKGCKSDLVQQEKIRCYSSCGYIIKFLEGGNIEILGANGTLYTIFEIKDNSSSSRSSERINKDLEESETLSLAGRSAKPQKRTNSKKRSKKTSDIKSDKKSTDSDERLLKSLEEELKGDFHLNIADYKYSTSDGKQFVVKNAVIDRIEDILTITSVDISNNCVNSERLDGVTSTHWADGSLTVYFPDGSCITSIPVEAEEIFCEWTTSEYDLWFTSAKEDPLSTTPTPSNIQSQLTRNTATSIHTKSATSVPLTHESTSVKSHKEHVPQEPSKSSALNSTLEKRSHSISKKNSISVPLTHESTSVKSHEKQVPQEPSNSSALNITSEKISHSISNKNSLTSSQRNAGDQSSDDLNEKRNVKIIYSEDGFVVYSLNYFMEHPNYSSIYYHSDKREVELQLPFSTSVSLKSNGSYTALLEGVSFIVESEKVYLNKLNKNNNICRTVAINTKGPSLRPNDESTTEEIIKGCFDESAIASMSLEMQKKLLNNNKLESCLLYTVNDLGDEMFVDFNFKVREVLVSGWCGIQGSQYCCFVINKDLSGFKLINASEINQYIQSVLTSQGLVRISENIWSSLLTSLPVLENESQKWFMKRNNLTRKEEVKANVSTFGRKESYTKPFVKADNKDELKLSESEVMIVRILDKIPSQENVLSELKLALEEFQRCSKSPSLTKVTMDKKRGELVVADITNDPSILHNIYQEERIKLGKEEDMFRNNMKNTLLQSLIRRACITARKTRQKNKVEEFKHILRTKQVPPYHLSCFGQIHEILDEVLDNVNTLRKTPSKFERVVSVIDEILSLAVMASAERDSEFEGGKASNVEVCQEIMREVFENFHDLSKQKSHQNLISSILVKPLNSVTTEEIEILCQSFQSGAGDCPISYDEEFVLQDVLEARHQLSHYFSNLKEMLEYYRDQVFQQHIF